MIRIGKAKQYTQLLCGNALKKVQFEDNIKTNLNEISCEDGRWIGLAEDRI
jgi:hypothetical protein